MVQLSIMGAVLRVASPKHPDAVTQRAYNEARGVAGYPGSTRANKLAEQFRVPWAVLRHHALHSETPARSLAQVAPRDVRRVLTAAEMSAALRRVAGSLGTNTLSVGEYEAGRKAMEERAARRYRHATHLVSMPHAAVIMRKGSWAQALADAGLVAPGLEATALPRADAIEVFIEQFGFLPRQEGVSWMGRHHGIQLTDRRAELFSVSVETARQRYEAQGRAFPNPLPRGKLPADWQARGDGSAVLVELAKRYPPKRHQGQGYTLDEVRAAIATAYDAMTSGQRLTAHGYRAISRGLNLPSLKTVSDVAVRHELNFSRLVQDQADRRSAASAISGDRQ